MVYDHLPQAGDPDSGITVDSLLDTIAGNSKNNTHPITVSVSENVSDSKISTWSESVTATFGAETSVEVDAAPLGIGAKVTESFSWQVGVQFTHESSSKSSTLLLRQHVVRLMLTQLPRMPGWRFR